MTEKVIFHGNVRVNSKSIFLSIEKIIELINFNKKPVKNIIFIDM